MSAAPNTSAYIKSYDEKKASKFASQKGTSTTAIAIARSLHGLDTDTDTPFFCKYYIYDICGTSGTWQRCKISVYKRGSIIQ